LPGHMHDSLQVLWLGWLLILFSTNKPATQGHREWIQGHRGWIQGHSGRIKGHSGWFQGHSGWIQGHRGGFRAALPGHMHDTILCGCFGLGGSSSCSPQTNQCFRAIGGESRAKGGGFRATGDGLRASKGGFRATGGGFWATRGGFRATVPGHMHDSLQVIWLGWLLILLSTNITVVQTKQSYKQNSRTNKTSISVLFFFVLRDPDIPATFTQADSQICKRHSVQEPA
jgi:hypothetical protein